jgi:hypothetical protein
MERVKGSGVVRGEVEARERADALTAGQDEEVEEPLPRSSISTILLHPSEREELAMPWYELTKVVHFMGFIALFGFFVLYARFGPRLRSARTLDEVRTWLGVLEAARGMFHGGAAMFLLSGIVMAALRWRGPYPFVAVGMATLIVMWVLWAAIGSRHLRMMRAAVGTGAGAVPVELSRTILDPARWAVLTGMNGAALAVLVIMTTKPGLAWAVGLVLAAAAIGAVAGGVMIRRQRDAVVAAGNASR